MVILQLETFLSRYKNNKTRRAIKIKTNRTISEIINKNLSSFSVSFLNIKITTRGNPLRLCVKQLFLPTILSF